MIFVTEEVKMYVRNVSASVELPEGLVFRLDETGAGEDEEERLVVSVEEPKEGDQPVEHEGEDLLHISGEVSATYNGCVLDLEEMPQGTAFILLGAPQAESNVRH